MLQKPGAESKMNGSKLPDPNPEGSSNVMTRLLRSTNILKMDAACVMTLSGFGLHILASMMSPRCCCFFCLKAEVTIFGQGWVVNYEPTVPSLVA